MNIAVFGCGFVGGTVANFLQNKNKTVTRVDPKLHPDVDPQEAIFQSDGIIICVPTPSGEDGTCDDSIVRKILDMTDHRTKILLKSTVTYDNIKNYPYQLVYNPEFLRERHAEDDFKTQQFAIYGHTKNCSDDAKWWSDIFGFNPVFTDRETASLTKYIHNSWLATKVAWFHQLYQSLPPGVDYESLTDILAKFPNVGPSHMKAPNFDGTLGYSGACFPKDVKALTNVIDHSILEYIDNRNEQLNETKI